MSSSHSSLPVELSRTRSADPLPSHAALIAGADVWMESDALAQLARVARLPGCVRAVGMPDLHPGRGIPIGAVFLFEGRVLPDLVGGDAGCGVTMIASRKAGPRGDALERRVRAAWEEEPVLPGVAPEALLECAWAHGPAGLAALEGVPDALAQLAAALTSDASVDEQASGPLPRDTHFASQLGTIGGGNHFAEVSRVERVTDRALAKELRLSIDAQVVLVHSGSRGLGAHVASRYAGQTLEGGAIDGYLADLRGAVRYARTNRLLIAWRLLRAAGLGSFARVASQFDIVHNAVEPAERGAFLHRKGAAPAGAGQRTVVLGSRGAPSWIMSGQGSEACLCSVAHGAGRRLGRGDAYAKLRAKYTKSSLTRSALGARVLCDETRLMYEEHPDVYKPIEPVVASLEAAGAATRVASLHPLVTVKG